MGLAVALLGWGPLPFTGSSTPRREQAGVAQRSGHLGSQGVALGCPVRLGQGHHLGIRRSRALRLAFVSPPPQPCGCTHAEKELGRRASSSCHPLLFPLGSPCFLHKPPHPVLPLHPDSPSCHTKSLPQLPCTGAPLGYLGGTPGSAQGPMGGPAQK